MLCTINKKLQRKRLPRKASFNIAVLASTRGTDLQAIIDEIKAGTLDVDLRVVISNKKDCYALQRAREQGFKTFFIDPQGKTREEYDQELIKILKEHEVDLIVLVGYMRILTAPFIQTFRNRIINVHPSLIPKYCGPKFYDTNVHEAVLKAGEKETGMTIHFVTEEIDKGPIILQKKIPVDPNDTPETLKAKVQELEKKWYPEVIRWIQQGTTTATSKNTSHSK